MHLWLREWHVVRVYNQTASGNDPGNHSLLNERKTLFLCSALTPLLAADVWGVFSHWPILWHELGVLQLSSALSLSTWGEQKTPRVKGSVSQGNPTPDADHRQWSPGHSHFFLIRPQQIGGSSDPLLRFNNLLLCLTELRETLTFTSLWYNKEYAKGRKRRDTEDGPKGPKHRSFCPHGVRTCHPPSTWMRLPTQELWNTLETFMDASSRRYDY